MLFTYILSGFMLYCGIYNLVTFGYSDGSLVFIMIGAFVFLLKAFVCFRNFVKRISDSRDARASKTNASASETSSFFNAPGIPGSCYEDLYNKHIALKDKY